MVKTTTVFLLVSVFEEGKTTDVDPALLLVHNDRLLGVSDLAIDEVFGVPRNTTLVLDRALNRQKGFDTC